MQEWPVYCPFSLQERRLRTSYSTADHRSQITDVGLKAANYRRSSVLSGHFVCKIHLRFDITFIATSVKIVALRDEPTNLISTSYLSTTPLGSFGGFQETRHYKKHRYPCQNEKYSIKKSCLHKIQIQPGLKARLPLINL